MCVCVCVCAYDNVMELYQCFRMQLVSGVSPPGVLGVWCTLNINSSPLCVSNHVIQLCSISMSFCNASAKLWCACTQGMGSAGLS